MLLPGGVLAIANETHPQTIAGMRHAKVMSFSLFKCLPDLCQILINLLCSYFTVVVF